MVLVEGEKAAEALMAHGITATTAMNGAKAPPEKTDWSPLKGKHLLIWPDHDEAGHAYGGNGAKSRIFYEDYDNENTRIDES